MTKEQQDDINSLKELIADKSISADERQVYIDGLAELEKVETISLKDFAKQQGISITSADADEQEEKSVRKKPQTTQRAKQTTKPKKAKAVKKATPLPSDVDAMKKAIKERTGKTEAECEDIIAQYRKLRAKAKVNNAKRTEKLKTDDKLITGTNVITPVAQIEKDAEIVKAKIEKQVEQIENKAEREVVKKDKTKDEVKVEVEKKVVKELTKLSDEMVASATTFVKNIQTELKKVDKTEAKKFLLGLRNEIDALLSKFGDGGTTEIYNIAEMNSSSSSVNPSKFARGGGVGNPSKKQMLDYLNMYFDNYSELRTIAIEEDNILTRRMLNSLDNEELQMAYDDAKYEIKAETQFDNGGAVSDEIIIKSGNNGNLKVIYHAIKNQRTEWNSNEVFEQEKIKGKSVFLFVNDELYDEFIADGDEEEYKRGGGVRTGSDDREYPFGSAWALEHNKHNKKENYEIPTSSRKMGMGGETENDYVVNVGNIGNIHCDSLLEARMMYNEYVEQSKSGMGRAGNEYVGLYENGEPILEYFGTLDNDNEYKRGGVSGKDNRAKKVIRNVNGFDREYPIGDAWRKEHKEENKSEKYEVPYGSRKG